MNTLVMMPTRMSIVAIADFLVTTAIAAPQRGQVLAASRSTVAWVTISRANGDWVMGTHDEPPERITESVILICWRAIMLLIMSSVNGPPVCPVAKVTCHAAVGGEITSIVLAFAVPIIDIEVTAVPHLWQNRVSSAIVDPQLAQKPIFHLAFDISEESQVLMLGQFHTVRLLEPNLRM